MPKLETDSKLVEGYRYGFVTDVQEDTVPKGLSEDTIRHISKKKNEPESVSYTHLPSPRD